MDNKTKKRKHHQIVNKSEKNTRLRVTRQNHEKCQPNSSEKSEEKPKEEKKMVDTGGNNGSECSDGTNSFSDRTDLTDELAHFNECVFCEDGGKLICCDYCPRVYHQRCLQIANSPKKSEDWMCPTCFATYKKKKCKICEESIAKMDEEYALKCPLCKCLMHFECMAIPLNLLLDTPKYHSYSQEDLVKFKDNDRKIYLEYMCIDCMNGRKVDTILDFYNRETNDPNASCENNYYLCKFKKTSLYHSVWIIHDIMRLLSKSKLTIFLGKYLEPDELMLEDSALHGILPEKIDAERVIDKSIKALSSGERTYYLIKWRTLPYLECTWETKELVEEMFPHLVTKFNEKRELEEKFKTTEEYISTIYPRIFIKNFINFTRQPDFVSKGVLRKYQMDGVNWLITNWYSGANVILADEIGLGKTIQAICFLKYLKTINVFGPFLVIAPLSKLDHWYKEFSYWFEECDIVILGNDKESRKIATNRDMFYRFAEDNNQSVNRTSNNCKFNVLLTSPSVIGNSGMSTFFKGIVWEVVLIDESHRSINKECKLTKKIEGLNLKFIIIINGTPIQNKLSELSSVVEVVCPNLKGIASQAIEKINTATRMRSNTKKQSAKDEDVKVENVIEQLQIELNPFILRREKHDVYKELPIRKEFILLVNMTPLQKKMYRAIYTKNCKLLKDLQSKIKVTSCLAANILSALMLCASHPLLLSNEYKSNIGKSEYWIEDKEIKRCKEEGEFKYILSLSEKMQLLDALLAKLLPLHKVLIFCHVKEMLDILQKYLTLKGIKCSRLDTYMPYSKRYSVMEQFNNSSSENLVMLLSTQVGGLHVNVSSADTIILFDSNYNPYIDEQTVSKVHRTGEVNSVLTFRFITRYSIEHRLIEIAKSKVLEKVSIKPNKQCNVDFKDLIQFGIDKVFSEDVATSNIEYTDAQLEGYIDRSLSCEENSGCDFFEAFKMAPFEISACTDDQAFNRIINEESKKIDEVMYAKLDKGKKQDLKHSQLKKKKLEDIQIEEHVITAEDPIKNKEVVISSADIVQNIDQVALQESSLQKTVSITVEETKKEIPKKKQSAKSNSRHSKGKQILGRELTEDIHSIIQESKAKERSHLLKINSISKTFCNAPCKLVAVEIIDGDVILRDNSADRSFTYSLNCMSNDLRCQLVTWGFNEINRMDFVSALMKYGVVKCDWAALYNKIKSNDPQSSINIKSESEFAGFAYNFAVSLNAVVKQQKESLQHFLCSVYQPISILQRISDIAVINDLVESYKANPDDFAIVNSVIFDEANESMRSNNIKWDGKNDVALLIAVLKHGYGETEKILADMTIWPFSTGCTNKNAFCSQWVKIIAGDMEPEITESTTESLREDYTEYDDNAVI